MPDFENLRKALLCQGEPQRVPLFEGTIAEDIKNAMLGRQAVGLEDEVEFYMAAGYDFVPLTIGLRQTLRGETSGIMGTKQVETSVLEAAEAHYNPFSGETSTRMWAEADEFSYDAVERLG